MAKRPPEISVDVTPDPDEYEAAIASFRKRVPMPDYAWDALEEEARQYAFKVSGVTQAEMVSEVYEAIDKAIAEGTTLKDFTEQIGATLTEAWGHEDAFRVETIFRTNVQTAYSAGRTEMYSRPAVKEAAPFLRYDDIDDDRECDTCGDWHGTILAQDDPAWEDHTPPLHFNCRCQLTPLSQDEADEEGVAEEAPDREADDGFGAPVRQLDEWEPDLSQYPDEVADVLQETLAQAPEREVEPEPERTPLERDVAAQAASFEAIQEQIAKGADHNWHMGLRPELKEPIYEVDDAIRASIGEHYGAEARKADKLFQEHWVMSPDDVETQALMVLARDAGLASSQRGLDVAATEDIKYISVDYPGAPAAVRARYDATQAALRELGIDEIEVYRGVAGEQAAAITAAVGEGVELDVRELSSWSTVKEDAEEYAETMGGVVVKFRVPARQVYSSWHSSRVLADDSREVIVLRQGKIHGTLVFRRETTE